MRVTVCPVTTIDAPVERVWSLLTDPRKFGEWADLRFETAQPDGLTHVGQHWRFSTTAFFGRRWPVSMTVTHVAADRRSLGMDVALPLGIGNEERMTLARLSDDQTRVQFN